MTPMFEDAEKDPVLDSAVFELEEEPLRTELVLRQYELLKRADRSILVVVAGIDGAGKGSAVNLLNEWLDPRHVRTLAFGPADEQEAARPAMWRYWYNLPAKGHIGIVFGSWYAPLIAQAARKKPDAEAVDAMAAAITRFESMLAADGVQIVKLWFHLSKEAQQARCDELLSNPDTAWRVSDIDLKVARKFSRLREAGRATITATHTDAAPWVVIPSADARWRIAATAREILKALRHSDVPTLSPAAGPTRGRVKNQFAGLDYSACLDKDEYEKRMLRGMARLGRAVRSRDFGNRSLVLVFEGDDAAGKGGSIRRITRALDARQYGIMSVAAPTDEERARPYLWRFWRQIPALGRIGIFDRSWYGRVLVERVEGLAAPGDWQRAYSEIEDFEAQLVAHGAVVVKFWLSITQQEQLKRFHKREKTPFKAFKITEEDWRNRKKAPQYRQAASEMLLHTNTSAAPWHVVATNDKRLERVTVMETVAQALERALGHDAEED